MNSFELGNNSCSTSSRASSSSPAAECAVVVVDPYTEGATLAKRFAARGYKVVHVISDPTSDRAKSVTWEDEQLVVRHSGDKEGTEEAGVEQLIEKIRFELNEVYGGPVLAVAAGAEEGVPLAEKLASTLGLPTNRLELSKARRDKWAMMEAVRNAGLRAAEQAHVMSAEEATRFYRALPGAQPVAILKPRSSMKSEDVYLCKSEEDVLKAYNEIAGKRNFLNEVNEGALAQEYLDGEEYVVDAVSCQGVHKVNALFHIDRYTANGQFNVMHGARLMNSEENGVKEIVEYASGVLTALGVENGASHMELKYTSTGPCLIEAAARPCGDPITPLLDECLGKNQMDMIIDALLHPNTFLRGTEALPPMPIKGGRQCFIVSNFGDSEIVGNDGLDLIRSLPSVRTVYPWRRIGDLLEKTVDQRTQAGFLLQWHEDEAVVERDYEEIRRLEKIPGGIFQVVSSA